MKRRIFSLPAAKRPLVWLVLICLVGFNLQAHVVSAQQDGEASPEPTVETATPSAEEIATIATNTTQETPTFESATAAGKEAKDSAPSPVPSATPEGSATPEPAALIHPATLSGNYTPDEVLVRFKKSASGENITQCLSSSETEIISIIEELNVWVVRVPSGKVAESIALISTCPGVRYAEPNYRASIADTIPSDPGLGAQYGLVNIRAPQGWDYSTGSSSVTIAILDTGVDLGHADLASKIVPGYDFVNDDTLADDDHFQSHGTHAAGIAAAIGNNGVGVAGVSWGARIMPVKVLNAGGGGSFADAADGIIWAADHGAQIINVSLGGTSPSTVLHDAVNYAYGKGVIIVAAAGNDNGTIRYPARYPNVIAVGAVDSLNNRAGTSNYGSELDLVAPGVNIYSTVVGGYDYNSGTSMAAPYVSGLAAILYGILGNGSSGLVTSQMESTALDLGSAGFDVYHGFGLIQMDSALKLVLPPTERPARELPPSLFAMPTIPTFVMGGTNTHTPTVFPTATFTSLPITTQPTDSETPPEVEALSIQKEPTPHARSSPSWQMPCAGAALVLAGLLLFWAAGRIGRKTQLR